MPRVYLHSPAVRVYAAKYGISDLEAWRELRRETPVRPCGKALSPYFVRDERMVLAIPLGERK